MEDKRTTVGHACQACLQPMKLDGSLKMAADDLTLALGAFLVHVCMH